MNYRVIGFILIFSSFTASWAWMDYQSALRNPAVNGAPVLVEIEKGDSLKKISEKLLAQHLLIKPVWFKVIAVLGKTYKKIKTGEYELKPGVTVPQILDQFAQGKTKQYSITFPEGWSFSEIVREVENNPNLEHQLTQTDLTKLVAQLGIDGKNPNNCQADPGNAAKQAPANNALLCADPAFAAVLPTSVQSPEGLFFPDTYFFEKHMSDVSLLKRAYDKMQSVLQREWLNKAENLPFKTPYEALILASIVEKETGNKIERPAIAGVFIRRLQNDMLLQTDPTVIYGMGETYHGNIGANDLKTATPYNTYLIKGLPPTPIAMPGLDAIVAVLHPDQGDSLYFVSRGDGTHEFSPSLRQHNLAVGAYQRKKRD